MKLGEYLIRRWLRKLPEGLAGQVAVRMAGEAIQDRIADTLTARRGLAAQHALDELAAYVCGLTGVPPSRGAR